MKYIDLFAGIGGFHYGIERAFSDKSLSTIEQDGKGRNGNPNKEGGDVRNRFVTPLCVYSNEWDKYANSVYRKHFKECDQTDITKVNAADIPDHDLLCGGFPCQSFSIAGKRGGFDDTRGTLFFDIARILKEKRPRLCLLENVKGLLSHDDGRTIKTIFATLTELGYDLQWQVLNSKNHGVSQNRERIFIIGHLRGTPRPQVFPIGEDGNQADELPRHIANILTRRYEGAQATGTYIGEGKQYAQGKSGRQGIQQEGDKPDNTDSRRGKAHTADIGNEQEIIGSTQKHASRMKNQSKALTEAMGKGGGHVPMLMAYSSSQRKDHVEHRIKEGEANCLTTGKGCAGGMKSMSFVKEEMKIRRLTPVECERLQGFPDNWTKYGADGELISDTQRYKMCGNAVTTNVITTIAKRLMEPSL